MYGLIGWQMAHSIGKFGNYCIGKSWKFLTSIAICVILCFTFAIWIVCSVMQLAVDFVVDNIDREMG